MNKNPANFVPLTPISFLHRTADIYGEHQSVLYENRSYTWRESRERCVRIASSLNGHGVMPGDTVSVLAFNTPEMFESHFSIPMAGAILNTINIDMNNANIPKTQDTVPLHKFNSSEIFFSSPPKFSI